MDIVSDSEIESVVRRYSDMVYRIALLNMKNTSDAEDVFQDVFLRLVENLHKLQSEEHRKAWLIRVTVNCCKKRFSSAWRRKTVAMPEGMDGPAVYDPEPQGEVYAAVQALPERYRQVIHLFYFEDMSVRQVGAALGIREETIKSQLSRGRALLKEALKEEYFDVR